MSYNLFIDDVRVPYLDPLKLPKQNGFMVSAYSYTKYQPFKDEDWIIVRNYDEFVNCVQKRGIPNLVAFDHDLSYEHYRTNDVEKFVEKTGFDCAKWLCDYCMEHNCKFPDYYIHSMNPVGKNNIENYIENYKKYCEF
jgi:hypothetical protein